MESATNTTRLHRRATVFKLARHLGEVGLRVNPDAMLREMENMEGMEGLASGHTRAEIWQILGELRKIADARQGR
jgi:predicted component of type VI protein secretion system